MIGQLLGNRYRILELIGEGGMALVYKAECVLLQRTVAVKILRPQYSSDKEFVTRFRREAQAAASLSHPNVVNIYDVGQDGGVHYIVMELIEGDNLKSLIRKEAPLPVNRALHIALQICEALRHAHDHNIIHRDIKPHNILLTADGRVKVTDFGIARAISAGGFTQTGVVMGSVQYFSPEQAKGQPVGPQSDLYALGCVLYEMLTGEVPFTGESPIAIALKHIQEKPVSVKKLRPGLPPGAVRVIEKALAKDPEERYPSAWSMIIDLRAALGIEPPEEKRSEDYPTQILTAPVGEEREEEKEFLRVSDEPEEGTERGAKKDKSWGWVVITVFAALLLFGVSFLFFIPSQPVTKVPDLTGLTLVEAKSQAGESGLGVKAVRHDYSEEVPLGHIITQDPKPGRSLRRGRDIEVVLSRGKEMVLVPDLSGKTRIEAEIILEDARLKLGDIYHEPSNEVPRGLVVRQKPAPNLQIERGATVDLYLSRGQDYVEMPNFIGRPLVEVQAELASLGLVSNLVTEKYSVYPRGQILDHQPPPGSVVPVGTPVNFVVSGAAGRNNRGEEGLGNSYAEEEEPDDFLEQ
ncbi:MAG TPA: Stk1 family PASTA domain-containing Ser/Thr kinase [Firmicutes bacterium]|nr:Stk1 family PASTA domain-containing Ser/Thr kinase [Bacillota bacterium]